MLLLVPSRTISSPGWTSPPLLAHWASVPVMTAFCWTLFYWYAASLTCRFTGGNPFPLKSKFSMGNFSFPCRKPFLVQMWSMQPADGLQGFWPHWLCSTAVMVGADCQLALPRFSLHSRTAETVLWSFQNEVLCNFREENFQNYNIFFSELTSSSVPVFPPPTEVIFFRTDFV